MHSYSLPFEFPPFHGTPASPLMHSFLGCATIHWLTIQCQCRGKKEGAKVDATRIELVIAIRPSYAVITLRRDAQEYSTWFAYSGMVFYSVA